jgi:hypothetical protein
MDVYVGRISDVSEVLTISTFKMDLGNVGNIVTVYTVPSLRNSTEPPWRPEILYCT